MIISPISYMGNMIAILLYRNIKCTIYPQSKNTLVNNMYTVLGITYQFLCMAKT